MKYVDEFRDPVRARAVIDGIGVLAGRIMRTRTKPLQVMEVCGGHTHAIFRFGLAELLPGTIEFVHGPGCPVCVLPMGVVDDCVSIAMRPEVILTTFGDAMRVPGSRTSLLAARAAGADVRMVYSPLDALALARANPARQVVFFGIGFETTMPATALTVQQAEREGIANFSLFCNHITIIPTLRAVLDSPGMQIDGFLGPGHVSMVIGSAPYRFIAAHYRKPLVIAGFEPLDVLQSLWMLLAQIDAGRCEIENQYARVAEHDGNATALAAMSAVFEPRESCEWRGLGSIERSGVRMRERYAAWDAERRFPLARRRIADPAACRCGEVLRGAIKPWQCALFGKACTPATPLGALMVSSEGACAAYIQYARRDDPAQPAA